ncbi:hypothetical protein [Faecalimonas sp.]
MEAKIITFYFGKHMKSVSITNEEVQKFINDIRGNEIFIEVGSIHVNKNAISYFEIEDDDSNEETNSDAIAQEIYG